MQNHLQFKALASLAQQSQQEDLCMIIDDSTPTDIFPPNVVVEDNDYNYTFDNKLAVNTTDD